MFRSIAVALWALALPELVIGQTSGFRFDAARADAKVGTVLQYEKSNIDGTHKGNVSLYVASRDRIESLKWHPSSSEATLVTAELDWEKFTARRLQSWQLPKTGERTLKAMMEYSKESDTFKASFMPGKAIAIKHWPWHSYDFDFASLNIMLGHRIDPQAKLVIGIADVVYLTNGVEFGDKGKVEMVYLGEEEREKRACSKYRIDGEGLENKGGLMWVDKEQQVLVDYEIALPDEPGLKSGKLRFLSMQKMSMEQWEQFIKEKKKGGK